MVSFWLANACRLRHCLRQYSGDEVNRLRFDVRRAGEWRRVCARGGGCDLMIPSSVGRQQTQHGQAEPTVPRQL